MEMKPGRRVPRMSEEYQNACQFSGCAQFDDEHTRVDFRSYKWVTIQVISWPGEPNAYQFGQFHFCSIEHLCAWAQENKAKRKGLR